MKPPAGTRIFPSPLRGVRLTAVLGLVLLAGLSLVALTGFASHAAYEPRLPGNNTNPVGGPLESWLVGWPSSPAWLYRVTQGTHVILGLALVPVVLAKLWSVMPLLFRWPPARSAAQGLERISIFLLVSSTMLQLVTGVLNIQTYYVFPFSFYTAHYYGAWVFIAAMALHVALKAGTVRAALRSPAEPGSRSESGPGAGSAEVAEAGPVPGQEDPRTPGSGDGGISRRGLLGAVAGASATIVALSVGQTLDGPLRRTALLAPRGLVHGSGPNDFAVNKTAVAAGIDPGGVGPGWRLDLTGTRSVRLSRAELLALPQYTYRLPISCVEGWSTEQSWTGVRLSDLARLAGVADPGLLRTDSMQAGGGFGFASLSARQLADHRSLLALRVNGVDLSLDHGFPARIIVPAAPGVHCTKWVARMRFR
ncbi:MAG: molybdopterin-dependent oxidoreductase [Pseudonocardiaceae bacterium]